MFNKTQSKLDKQIDRELNKMDLDMNEAMEDATHAATFDYSMDGNDLTDIVEANKNECRRKIAVLSGVKKRLSTEIKERENTLKNVESVLNALGAMLDYFTNPPNAEAQEPAEGPQLHSPQPTSND